MLEYIANKDAMLGNALSWNIIVRMTEDTKIVEKIQSPGKESANNVNNATKLSKDQSMCETVQCLQYFPCQFCLLEID